MFDDSLIISGANLSGDYFTNRQDRYLLIGINSIGNRVVEVTRVGGVDALPTLRMLASVSARGLCCALRLL